jgi:hypothetical protein
MASLTQPRTPPDVVTDCCSRFNPKPWDDVELVWHDKPFVKERVASLFHVPLNMAAKLRHANKLIEASDEWADGNILLCDELSPWRSDLYVEVTGTVPGAEMVELSGRFLTRVYDGPFRDAPHWVDDMKRHVSARGLSLLKLYFGYTTCPRCAKIYGHSYVVLFAQVEGAPTRRS